VKELSDAIDQAKSGDTDTLRAAAKRWAEHCLETYRGDLLKAGLNVSRALADFMNELETKP
jgi:hypothetical protein